jgi:hypothetical protein
VRVRRIVIVITAGFLLSLFFPPIYAQEEKKGKLPALDEASAKFIGSWEIVQTKEPGKPYLTSYKGRPFVSKGPQSFSIVLEYKPDGTFRRICRVDGQESVQEGTWKLSGHELKHQRTGTSEPEVMYVRFDGKNQFTFVEVYEETSDPGLFAQFKKVD